MMKILLGTTNPSKATYFHKLLYGYDVTFCTLSDLGITAEPAETGATVEENAVIKARFYGHYFDTVICGDSGMYFDSFSPDDARQPGLHIRTPGGSDRRLSDAEMLAYYAALARSLGGKALAYYINGVAVYHQGVVSSFMETPEGAKQHRSFLLVDTPTQIHHAGWPLDSLRCEIGDEAEKARFRAEYERKLTRFLCETLGLN